jgi:hypothetical protein
MSNLLCSGSNIDFETGFLRSIAKVSRNETTADRIEQCTTNSAVIQILNLLMEMDAAAFFPIRSCHEEIQTHGAECRRTDPDGGESWKVANFLSWSNL